MSPFLRASRARAIPGQHRAGGDDELPLRTLSLSRNYHCPIAMLRNNSRRQREGNARVDRISVRRNKNQ